MAPGGSSFDAMTDRANTASAKSSEPTRPAASAPPGNLSVGLFVIFLMMAAMVVVSVAYAVTMMQFLADGGYFIAYSSLCSTVPIMATIDQFLPFLVAGAWVWCIYLGVSRNPRFKRTAIVTSLLALSYGALNVILGPFTFRVGPADFDPSTVTCGRWPRSLTGRTDLEVLQIDWLGLPITTFALSLIFLSLTIYVYLRVSRRVAAVYRPPRLES